MRKYSFIIISIALFFSFKANGQYGIKKESVWDRIFWGGSIGFSLGTVTSVDVSPMAGYYITSRWSAGLGATYQYFKDNRYNFETDIYGGRLFSSFIVIQDFNNFIPISSRGLSVFLHGEFELLSLETAVFDFQHKYPGQTRFLIDSYLIGAGFKQKIGRRSAIELSFLWNLNELTYSPYSNPVMRLGISF